MNSLEITGATKDCLTREWKVEAIINGKRYIYTLSDYDYDRAMRAYRNGKPGKALNLLKGLKGI